MEIIEGIGVSRGVSMGTLRIVGRRTGTRRASTERSAGGEEERLAAAIRAAKDELEGLYESALARVGEREAEIFEIHKMMLEDDDLADATRRRLDDGASADAAVTLAGEELAARFREMDTEYMRARAADIIAVSGRVAELLRGEERRLELREPAIVAAEDLTPAETIGFERGKLLGFVTSEGSEMSHTAILARMMGVPAVVRTGRLPEDADGRTVMLDGGAGRLYIDPDEETVRGYREQLRRENEERERLEEMRGKRLTDGRGERVRIAANIGEPSDVDDAAANDAEGIGLFRSEFIFMRRSSPPSEEEQYLIYKEAAEKMAGEECVVRTLDVGADKTIPYLSDGRGEANPALGIRAVRLCLRMPELLRTQLRALYRAAAHGNISVMIPMIVLPSEVERVKEIAREARDGLKKENIPIGEMKIGIMIETPSAAILADLLAPMVDFFSIGTNDLIQYTLAADRENPDVAYLSSPLPESVRRCIRMTCDAARREGIPVSVCGELGADADEVAFLAESGVTKLSVAPSRILRTRAALAGQSEKLKTAELLLS